MPSGCAVGLVAESFRLTSHWVRCTPVAEVDQQYVLQHGRRHREKSSMMMIDVDESRRRVLQVYIMRKGKQRLGPPTNIRFTVESKTRINRMAIERSTPAEIVSPADVIRYATDIGLDVMEKKD